MRAPEQSDDLGLNGWAIIHDAEYEQPEAREALAPLVEWRRAAASRRDARLFLQLFAVRARQGEGYALRRREGGDREVPIDQLPRYVLLAGHPQRLSFAFQQQLATRRAVGRLYFRNPESYERYARAVVERESDAGPPRGGLRAMVEHDDATALLASRLAALTPTWVAIPATRGAIREMRNHTADVLLLSGHGACYPPDPDSNDQQPQQRQQGALVTADWAGGGSVEDALLSTDAIRKMRPAPNVVVQLTSYAAGTSQYDELRGRIGGARVEQARISFVAAHARRFLDNGALAFVGPLDRLWHFAPGTGAEADRLAADSLGRFFRALLAGQRVGSALDAVTAAGAEAAAALSAELDAVRLGRGRDDARIVGLYAAVQAARSLILIGDPAARACAPERSTA